MYLNFFGLHTTPFSIAPDPQFLYMSERHQEALAHLTYGLQGSGGFILLTGEVGTGKTTVSRALLEQLSESTRTAFILNPMLNEHELLATLCDEFGIRYAKRSVTDKKLTDKLSAFLLEAHANGEQCVVLIDEAQHLQPQVLEQLRLLTNLETNQEKLLRVILIGQPELQDLLRRRELRQLAQRITARYHLLPLQLEDTERYINYRLQVGGATRGLFDSKAISTVHKLSEGIPRRLNLLCDRALLAAYNEQAPVVAVRHVKEAAHELDGPMPNTRDSTGWGREIILALLIVIVLLGAYLWRDRLTPAAVEPQVLEQVASPSGESALLRAWQLPQPPSGATLCDWVADYQLGCLRGQMRFDQLIQINYPVLLELDTGDYQFIGSINAQPQSNWTGRFILFWQLPPGYFAEDESLYQRWLVKTLQSFQVDPSLPIDEQFRVIQVEAGLPVTGELDGATLAWLTAHRQTTGPRLQQREVED